MHGIAVNAPYLTRDFLQQKRCSAQLMDTTYVYDFPNMFREACKVLECDRVTLITNMPLTSNITLTSNMILLL